MVLLDWYVEKVCDCEARYEREVEPSACIDADVRGVVAVVLDVVRATRADNGVGAPICDFFGVSVGLLRELELVDEEDSIDFEPCTGLRTFGRPRGRMYGWRRAC
jgi:hypothetical protein